MNRQQRERQSQFVGITGADAGVAQRCLEAAGWSVEAAIEIFYSGGMHLQGAQRSGGAPRIDKDAIHRLFLRYRDAGEDGPGGEGDPIGVEGVQLLCEDLGVQPDDVVLLVLSWHLGAEAMCEYSQAEFEGGLATLAVDSLEGLKAKLPALRAELQDPAKLRQIYQYAYLFSREKGQKIVQLDVALAMWDLLAPSLRWPHMDAWQDFLRTHHKRAVSRDTWNQLFEFAQSVGPDFSNYDENAAWPYLIDDWVSEMRKQQANGGA